ncbi:unnamed protein product, partial [Effrenium voratum]
SLKKTCSQTRTPGMALRRAVQDDDVESQQATKDDESYAVGQVTIRVPLDCRPLPLLAVIVSFLPWAVPVALIADIALERRAISLFAFTAILVTSLVCEWGLKPLIGEPRPPTSACRTEDGKLLPGMPSGHVMMCQSMLIFYMLESIHHHALMVAVLLILAMPAMPWARWYNGDHTVKQVVVTFLAASLVGLVDYLIFLVLFQDSSGTFGQHALLADLGPPGVIPVPFLPSTA